MQNATHLLPGHNLGHRHRALEDESCPVCREVLLRKLGLRELLDVGRQVMRQDRVFPTLRDINRGEISHLRNLLLPWVITKDPAEKNLSMKTDDSVISNISRAFLDKTG